MNENLPSGAHGVPQVVSGEVSERLSPEHLQAPVEYTPSQEEVKEIFTQIIGEKAYTETRKSEDESGLYLWDVTIPDGDGVAEYSYMRKGAYAQGRALETAVHVTFYDADGMPNDGWAVAKCFDRKWTIIP